jgi:hypothetical protein
MYKPSDKLDFISTAIELYNYVVKEQKQKRVDEIIWIYKNSNNIERLREYFSKFLGAKRASELSDEFITELPKIQVNGLYSQMQMKENPMDTKLIKAIIQILKNNGY